MQKRELITCAVLLPPNSLVIKEIPIKELNIENHCTRFAKLSVFVKKYK
jgi:hypothetical protein